MPGWRNWQTRMVQVHVGVNSVQVQVLFPALKNTSTFKHHTERSLILNIHAKTCKKCEKLLKGIVKLDNIMTEPGIPYEKKLNLALMREEKKFQNEKRALLQKGIIWGTSTEAIILSIIFMFGGKVMSFFNKIDSTNLSFPSIPKIGLPHILLAMLVLLPFTLLLPLILIKRKG